MKQVLRDALDDRGYTDLTPVQLAVSDPDLEGRDLLVSAQTGSGKTLGFGLAIAPVLLGDAERFETAAEPLALIIAPTRELALQVKRELAWLFAKAGAVLASCVGGMDMRDERRALARGAHIVVATPGRLRDHIMRGSIDLSQIRSVVLDEADEMLDLGFREDLEFILAEAPDTRQTLLFSATVPKAIASLAKSYQKDAERIVTRSETSQHADITYRAMMVSERDTENAVINTLLYHRAPNAIVFGNTRAMVNRLTTRLSNRGFQVVALSGELSQSERTHALQAMRDGRAQVCVATDVAARGIDLPNLDLVVHAELPSSHETLLHRSGRTGRAGRKGVSALVVTKKTRKKAERILGSAKLRAEWGTAPSADDVQSREEDRMFADDAWHLPVEEAEADTVARLMDGFSTEQLAAAYLRLYRAQRSAPEELSDPEAPAAPRPEFGPSVWFAVSGGRKAEAEPRRILPMLIKAGNIDKEDVGAIRVREEQSFVQLRETAAAGFVNALGDKMTLEPGAEVTQLAEPPQLGGAPSGPRKSGFKGKRDGFGGKSDGHRGKRDDFGARTDSGKPRGDKPWGDKPRGDKPKYEGSKPKFDKPKFEKPKSGSPKSDRPHSDGPKPAWSKSDRPKSDRPKPPRAADPSTPIDWNDTPTPKRKKPKPQDRPGSGTKAPHKPRRGAEDGEALKARKPRQTLKGPKPPDGKPSSKKNRARAAAQAAERRQAGKQGGKFTPKRPKG